MTKESYNYDKLTFLLLVNHYNTPRKKIASLCNVTVCTINKRMSLKSQYKLRFDDIACICKLCDISIDSFYIMSTLIKDFFTSQVKNGFCKID